MSYKQMAWSLIWVFLSTTVCVSGAAGEKEQPADASDDCSIDLTTLSAVLAARVSQRSSENGFTGSVLVSRDGEIILHRTFGPLFSRSGEFEPAYWIASGTKQFTGVVIALLVSAGTLDLDAQIGRYL